MESGARPEIVSNSALKVITFAEQTTYNVSKAALSKPLKVEQNRYTDFTKEADITNEGAGPCSILYVRDKKNGEVLSSHFPIVSLNRINFFINSEIDRAKRIISKDHPDVGSNQDTLILPTKEETQWLTRAEVARDSAEFLAFVAKITQLLRESPDGYDVYMFGQSAPIQGGSEASAMKSVVKHIAQHFELSALFLRLGFSPADIHDYRKPDQDSVTNTCYDSADKTIYVYSKQY